MILFDYYYKFLKVLLILSFVLLTVVVTYQLLSRNVELFPRFSYTEELSRWIFAWFIFIGAAVGVRENEHFLVDLFSPASSLNKYLDILSIIIIGLTSVMLIIIGINFFQSGLLRVSPASGLSLGIPYLSISFAGFSMLVFVIEKIFKFNKQSDEKDVIEKIIEEEGAN